MRRPRGFSLIELLLVLVIVSLAVSVVYVGLDGALPSSRLASAARRLGATIALAKREAVLRGQETKLEVDLGAGKVRVLVPGNQEQSGNSQTNYHPLGLGVALSDTVKITSVLLSASEVKTAGVVTISCQPTGNVTAHILHLEGEGGLVYSIQVHALTGTINYHDEAITWPAVVRDSE